MGKRCAEKVKKAMIKHYVRLVYIDMGYEDQDFFREFSRMAAEKLNLNPVLRQATYSKAPWQQSGVVLVEKKKSKTKIIRDIAEVLNKNR